MKPPKQIIDCHNCKEPFKRFSTTQKYCSPKCKIEAGAVTKIKPRSEKRAKEESIYIQLRKAFLNKEENRFCPVMLHLKKGLHRTTEVHHTKGRIANLLLDTKYWLALSHEGHKWVHDNPSKSYELGFLISSSSKTL